MPIILTILIFSQKFYFRSSSLFTMLETVTIIALFITRRYDSDIVGYSVELQSHQKSCVPLRYRRRS